jgi:hypothetical protein
VIGSDKIKNKLNNIMNKKKIIIIQRNNYKVKIKTFIKHNNLLYNNLHENIQLCQVQDQLFKLN